MQTARLYYCKLHELNYTTYTNKDVIKEIIGIKVFSYPSLFRGKFLKT